MIQSGNVERFTILRAMRVSADTHCDIFGYHVLQTIIKYIIFVNTRETSAFGGVSAKK